MEEIVVTVRGIVFFGIGLCSALAVGWIAFPDVLYQTEAQPLQFSHLKHTGESVGLSCDGCHAFSSDGRFTGIPPISSCVPCHTEPTGTSANEQILIRDYISKNREIPWKVYSRQPDNAFFSHAFHVSLASIPCQECHGPHGQSDSLRSFQVNRISGYSRDIWGANISGIPSEPWQGMKMDRCINCHASHDRRDGCIECHK
jgi:hypothetical protein